MSQAPFPHKWRVIPPPVLIVLVALSLYDPSLKAMMVKHLSNQIRVPSPWKTCGPPERGREREVDYQLVRQAARDWSLWSWAGMPCPSIRVSHPRQASRSCLVAPGWARYLPALLATAG